MEQKKIGFYSPRNCFFFFGLFRIKHKQMESYCGLWFGDRSVNFSRLFDSIQWPPMIALMMIDDNTMEFLGNRGEKKTNKNRS